MGAPKQKILLALLIIFFLSIYFIKKSYHDYINEEQFLGYINMETLLPEWADNRMAEQKNAVADFNVFHDFQYSDVIEISKIEFEHKINPYSGKIHKPIHYDHGNGVTVADIDGDGNYDIYFVSQVGMGELWRNLGNGQFENITKKAGLEITDKRSCVSASFADIDNDGDPDLLVTVIRDGNFLFENQGNGVFEDISETARVNYNGHSSGVCFLDYNNDGLLDIFLSNVGSYTVPKRDSFKIENKSYSYYIGSDDSFGGHLDPEKSESSLMYKNMGGNIFKNVTNSLGLENETWSGDAIAMDGNDDGYVDLYLTNMQGNDEYYENDKGKRFIKKSREIFPKTSWGAMGVAIFDFDNDGKQDIYITDMHSDMGSNISIAIEVEKIKRQAFPESFLQTKGKSIAGNTFFKKKGSNSYEEISDLINAENYWPWGLSTGDLNADGFEDVFVTKSMNYPFRYSENGLLLNDNGKRFLDSEYILGIEPRKQKQYAKLWFNLDCDGKDKGHKHCRNKKGEVNIMGALGSRSSVIFDYDNDGDLDVITNEFNHKPMVLQSNLSNKKQLNFLKIKLEGTFSNRDGLGAVVTVTTSEGTYTKVHDGKSGYLSSSSLPLYFGLGNVKDVISVKVTWPSGKRQVFEPILETSLNSMLIIKEE